MMWIFVFVLTTMVAHMGALKSQTGMDATGRPVQSVVFCIQNTTFTECSGCERRCEDVEPIVCPAVCGPPACQCSSRYRRNTDGRCVRPQDCPNPGSRCGNNEVYRECRTCEGTCKNPNPICTKICRPAGCECPVSRGFVRDNKGDCIPKSDCSRTCIGVRCPRGQHCILKKVVCIRAPCHPIPTCVDNRQME